MDNVLRKMVTISISSKDRTEDIDQTLQKIYDYGMGECPLIICDDGSNSLLSPKNVVLFANVKIVRNNKSKGQAVARNQIVFMTETPYLLQLDDDSYPVSGDMNELLRFVMNVDHWLAIAIPFEEPIRSRSFPRNIPDDRLIPVSSFVGCSVLINVQRFTELGGYASWIGRYAEEDELSIRAYIENLYVYTVDIVRVCHNPSAVNRNLNKILELSYRNFFLTWLLHAPPLVLLWRLFSLCAGAFKEYLLKGNSSAFKGIIDAIRMRSLLPKNQKRFTLSQYFFYRKLPHSLCRNFEKE